ncbi:echinoidin-like [Macrobrachium nipponense]|uniref:echinoidin-like n=1 Tax=Macrobrachium nipponense TaxID=159736 RepID=UPI0030C7FD5D
MVDSAPMLLLLLVAFGSVISTVSGEISCEPGWLQFGSSCFHLANVSGSWLHGYEYCNGVGGSLATVDSEDANYFIAGILAASRAPTVWIGFHDQQVSGYFEWISGRPTTFSNFAPGQPDYGVERNEDCVEIREDLEYQWADAYCFEHKGYLCSRDAE